MTDILITKHQLCSKPGQNFFQCRCSFMIINSVFNNNPAMTMSIPIIRNNVLTIDIANGNFNVAAYSLKAEKPAIRPIMTNDTPIIPNKSSGL